MKLFPHHRARINYALVLASLFAGGLLLAHYAPWNNARTQTSAYANLGGDFSLNSQMGEVQLQDFRGQLVLMYFGFTSCPEVCPTALSTIAASMRNLGPELEQQIQPLFVSVDPKRDSLDSLAAYSTHFHPRMLGLTASLESLDQLVRQYGAHYRYVALADSAQGYTVEHSMRVYLIGRQGQLLTTIAHGTPVAEVSKLLRQHL